MPQPILYVFSNEAIRELDARAKETYGIPGVVLMENAARAVAEQAETVLEDEVADRHIVICCGPGNNGGDGLGAARHLHNAGADVLVLACFDPATAQLSAEAAVNLKILEAMNILIKPVNKANVQKVLAGIGVVDLGIDALLGTGSTQSPRPPMDSVISWLNDECPVVLSVDLPTGLAAEMAGHEGASVRAAQTITFVGLKEGFLIEGADAFFGDVVVAEIGSPRELSAELGQQLET